MEPGRGEWPDLMPPTKPKFGKAVQQDDLRPVAISGTDGVEFDAGAGEGQVVQWREGHGGLG